MHRLLLICLAVVFVSATAVRADDGVAEINGDWQQIASNAGACPTCRISFEQRGTSLNVTANNGWAASLIAPPGDAMSVTGMGRWAGGNRAMAGQPFTVDFVLRGQRLYMAMLIEMRDGSKRLVRGVFGRVWAGV